jgi:hypothetical protein
MWHQERRSELKVNPPSVLSDCIPQHLETLVALPPSLNEVVEGVPPHYKTDKLRDLPEEEVTEDAERHTLDGTPPPGEDKSREEAEDAQRDEEGVANYEDDAEGQDHTFIIIQ